MAQDYVIGIDVGGQSTKLGIVDRKGVILTQTSISSLQKELSTYMHDLTSALEELIHRVGGKEKIKGIGAGAPNGNYYNGTIKNAPNLLWSYDENGIPSEIQFGKLIEEAIGLPVAITNDANAAAVGEMTYGIAKGMKDFIMITLGTGVGSGIVIGGQVVYGHDGFAGELGHTIAIRDGRPCGCGRKGCLEAYTSAIGVARTAREYLTKYDTPSLLRKCDFDTLTSKDIYLAAKEGDELAIEIFDFTGRLLGQSFADFVAFSAPEAIILFGGLARSREFIEQPIIESMNENLLSFWQNNIKILFSNLKDSDAAILGASALGWEL